MGFWADYNETVAKLKKGEKLNEREINTLVWDGVRVDEIKGDSGRWTQHIGTIIEIDGELWRIDWEMGLTECQDDEFWNQPYRVKKIEKEVTRIEVSYERV